MNKFDIVILALSLAFFWVEVLKLGSVKPFICMKCMTGWFALIIGCYEIGWWGLLYAPVGIFFGALFSAIKMKL